LTHVVGSPGWRWRLRFLAYGLSLVLLAAASAELTARIQDWLVDGTALTGRPDSDRDLFVQDANGRRGRPNGHYKKWVLNDFGFRSPATTLLPQPGTTRVIVLGASESFGLYESPGHEFPAQLGGILEERGSYEVINAALTGLTLRSSRSYWDHWVSRFHPAIVVIYPSPLFSLNEGAGARLASQPAPGQEQANADTLRSLIGASRLLDRARDRFDVPDAIQRWRDERTIQAATHDKPADWFYSVPPRGLIDQYVADLDLLTRAIATNGARPVVLTHASRVPDPPRPEDEDWLSRARVNVPRAMPHVIGQFETLTNEAIRDWGARSGVQIVDVERALRGRSELFGDLIHFNDDGAGAIARLIADAISGSAQERQHQTEH